MAYVVVYPFYDLTDFIVTKSGPIYHHYNVGERYPRTGKDPDKARCEYLESDLNPLGVPLIKKTDAEEVYEALTQADFAAPEPEPDVSGVEHEEMVSEEEKRPKKAKSASKEK